MFLWENQSEAKWFKNHETSDSATEAIIAVVKLAM
jgi:hypothetical protein